MFCARQEDLHRTQKIILYLHTRFELKFSINRIPSFSHRHELNLQHYNIIFRTIQLYWRWTSRMLSGILFLVLNMNFHKVHKIYTQLYYTFIQPIFRKAISFHTHLFRSFFSLLNTRNNTGQQFIHKDRQNDFSKAKSCAKVPASHYKILLEKIGGK